MNVPPAGNKVQVTLIAIAAAALGLGGFVVHAANRLVTGQPIGFIAAADGATIAIMAPVGAALLVLAWFRGARASDWAVIVLAALSALIVLLAAGQAAAVLARGGSHVARTSLGAGFWIAMLCFGLMIVDALQRLKARVGINVLVALLAVTAVGTMARYGCFDAISIVQEYQQRRVAFATECGRHGLLALAAVLPALAIGVPLGIVTARRPAIEGPVFTALNFVQTVPSIALFGLLIGPLSALGKAIPALGANGISGIGFAPAAIALILYSLLPIVRNTHAGIVGVDTAIVESATGAGLTRIQILFRVELPLAAPILLAGVRIVTVQAIGLAVVAALVGAGGLGTFVFQGLGQNATDLVLLGALPAIGLALAADFVLRSATALVARRTG